VPSGPANGGAITAQGSPRAIFQKAIERGNLPVAEMTLRVEISRPTLVDLLELTALIALKEPQRHPRVSARWLQRWLEAHPFATLYDAAFAVASLQALGSRHHQQALSALRVMAEEATSQSPGHGAASSRSRASST
jgi:hypothetical protein